MTKNEFLIALEERLAGLPQGDIQRSMEYYGELLDDRIEEGMSEDAAVADLPPMEEIVAQIIAEVPITRLMSNRLKPKRRLEAWEIILLALGFPLWFSLLAAVFSVALAAFAVIWSLVVTCYAVAGALAGSSFLVVTGFAAIVSGEISGGFMTMGMGFVCAGLAIAAFYLSHIVGKGVLSISKKLWIWIKRCFVKEVKA